MRKLLMLGGLLAGATIAVGLAAPALAAPPTPDTVKVSVEPTRVSTVLGDRFSIETAFTNSGSTATGPLLAHLNIASITGKVYVDPEDWSSNRSREISLQPGQSSTLTWPLQAVNSGSFAVYVAVLPFDTATAGNEPLAVSPMIRLEVATRSTLSAGGALPVALAVPVLLGLATAGSRLRLRRQR